MRSSSSSSSSTPADAFGELADRCGLRVLSAEPLYAAPRDLLAPPSESEQHVLLTLASASRPEAPAVRVLFAVPLADVGPGDDPTTMMTPPLRDVLWWLAGDAWAVERAGGDVAAWSAIHAHPPGDPAALRLHALHRRQADALRDLLGEGGYRALLDAYDREVAPRDANASANATAARRVRR